MSTHWTARLARNLAELLHNTFPAGAGHYDDADARRIQSELSAIRARFPDHA